MASLRRSGSPRCCIARQLVVPRKDAEDRVGAIRTEITSAEARFEAAKEETDASDIGLQALAAERTNLATAIKSQEELATIAEHWSNYRTQLTDYQERANRIVDQIAAFLEARSDDPAADLTAAQAKIESSIESARATSTKLQVADARSERAAELLSEEIDRCPTCLRPISNNERAIALNEHGAARSGAQSEYRSWNRRISRDTQRLGTVTELAAKLAALVQPEQPDADDPGVLAREELQTLRDREITLAGEIGHLEAEVAALADRSKLHDEIAGYRVDLNRAAAEEQLIASTIDVLNNVADRTLTDRIDPLLVELSHRWKTLLPAQMV